MILVNMEMTVFPAKRGEFFQTVHALVQSIRKEKGCIKCSACQDIEDENTFSLYEIAGLSPWGDLAGRFIGDSS